MKKMFLLIGFLALFMIIAACEDSTTTTRNNDRNGDIVNNEPNGETEWLALTLEQLAEYDGRDGRRGIIAYEGYLYEVTDSSRWPNGQHVGAPGITAGNDLTTELNNNTRHGAEVLSRVPRIGELIE